MLNPKITAEKRFEFETLFWSSAPYQSKLVLQEYDDYVDVTVFTYKLKDRLLHGLKIEPKKKDQRYPVIIYNRGGNNTIPNMPHQDMGITIPQLAGANVLRNAAKDGYVIYTTQLSGYGADSGSDEFGGEDVNDVLALKELIETNPICDSNRIGMLGYSRGGMMSYLALTKADWVRTIAVVGAPTNLLREADERPEMQRMHELAFGGSKVEKVKRSILFNVDRLPSDANILMLHSKKDDRVNYLDAVELDKKLKETDINHKLVLFEEGSHGLGEYRQERNKEILDWFQKYL